MSDLRFLRLFVTVFKDNKLIYGKGYGVLEAVKAATIVPAQTLNSNKELGTIETGKLADLILVDGNPLQRIGEIRNVKIRR